jgi:hypothetical protein
MRHEKSGAARGQLHSARRSSRLGLKQQNALEETPDESATAVLAHG